MLSAKIKTLIRPEARIGHKNTKRDISRTSTFITVPRSFEEIWKNKKDLPSLEGLF
jgi:hypothetical protein